MARALLELVLGLSIGAVSLYAGATAWSHLQVTPRSVASRVSSAVAQESPLREHASPVASYTLRASLDTKAHTLHGEGEIAWVNASSVPVNELWVHLYMNAFKSLRTVFLRSPPGGFRGEEKPSTFGSITVTRFAVRELDGADLWPSADPTSPGEPDDATDIRVPLPHPVAPGAALTIDVAWDEALPSVSFRTGFSNGFHMVGQWFPKIARLEPDGVWKHFAFDHLTEFYADFGAYDVTVDTPDDVIVGATGVLANEERGGGRMRRRFVQGDVHDFAFAAWADFQELRQTVEGVDVRCLYPPGYERAAQVELDTVSFGLAYFGAAYGRYPYPTLTVIHPPAGANEAGGMEYPTLITSFSGGMWAPRLGSPFIDVVTIHELGHQWFYGIVASDEHAWPFLDEGVNSYAEADAMGARYDGGSGAGVMGLTVALTSTNRLLSVEHSRDAPVLQAASAFADGAEYGRVIYQHSATVLATFANVYGADIVRGIVGRYARKWRFLHPTPEAFLAAFAEELGPDAAETLRLALMERGNVDYVVESVTSEPIDEPSGQTSSASGGEPAPAPPPSNRFRGSAFVRRFGTLRFPVDVDLIAADGTRQRVSWDARTSSTRLPYTGASRLVAAVVDPQHRVLLDEDLGNNARRTNEPILSREALDLGMFGAALGIGGVSP